MGSIVLPHLHTAWHTDQAILSESERLVVIRFGKDGHPDCLRQDDVLAKVAEKVKSFAVIYLCDIDEVPDFNSMYELYDPMTIMVCLFFLALGVSNSCQIAGVSAVEEYLANLVLFCFAVLLSQ